MCKRVKKEESGLLFGWLDIKHKCHPFSRSKKQVSSRKFLISKSTITKIKLNQSDLSLVILSEVIPFYLQQSLDLEFMAVSCICCK